MDISDSLEPFYQVSHRSAGNMSYALGDEVETSYNRAQFISDCGVTPKQVVAAHLTEKGGIQEVEKTDWGCGVFCAKDAISANTLATAADKTFLFINVADCLAIGFFDPLHHICALAHAGYNGVCRHVPRQTIAWMVNTHNSNPQEILIKVSPAIHQESFTFRDRSLFAEPAWDNYLVDTAGNGVKADWIRFALDELRASGVREEHIQQSHSNTYTNHYFFSHQRQTEQGVLEKPEKGNHAVLIGWK